MRELDAAAGQPKGWAFRAFKQLLPQLVEGADFVVLDHQRDAASIELLHSADRLYRSSVKPVMLSPAAAARLLIGGETRQQSEPRADTLVDMPESKEK
jgi:hypothetical protein